MTGKRSVTDAEIGLIRTMLARGMKNRDIQFYFNRPERPVNSGRITGIKNGTYGAGVPVATPAELDTFIRAFRARSGAPNQPTPATDVERVETLFVSEARGDWRLRDGETDTIECKREVDVRKLGPVVRAIAGMANNRGGVILLGVEDKSGKVLGLPDDAFEKLDLVKITSAAKAHLQPLPSFRKGVASIGGASIGFIMVEEFEDKPIIIHRPGDRMDDGAIMFRYPAETAGIKFGDLWTLLEKRDARRLRALADATQRIAEIGVDHSAILDTTSGRLAIGERRPVQLDPDLLKRLNFIKEGEFDEVEGAPTLRLVGDVVSAEPVVPAGPRRVITDEDVLRNFLDQEAVFDPLEYVRFAVAQSSRDWLPIFYFASQAKLSAAALEAEIVGMTTTRARRKSEMLERVHGSRTAFKKHAGAPSRRLEALLCGDLTVSNDVKEAERCALALHGLPTNAALPKTDLLEALRTCRDIILNAEKFPSMSHIYRAAARLDEVFCRSGVTG